MVIIFTIVRVIEANIIFPLSVSNKVKINAIANIVAIFACGILRGAAGMILFILFLGILKLIADRTERLKVLS